MDLTMKTMAYSSTLAVVYYTLFPNFGNIFFSAGKISMVKELCVKSNTKSTASNFISQNKSRLKFRQPDPFTVDSFKTLHFNSLH